MKRIFALILLPVSFACNNGTDNKPNNMLPADTTVITPVPKAEELINPGNGIGKFVIGLPTDSAIALLGQPDSSDAAMGSALMSWYAKDANRYRTAIFAGRNMGNDEVSRIKRIMVEAPGYKTADGIAPGVSMAEIEKYFQLKQVNDPVAQSKGLLVYDDIEKGIIFDIDSVSKLCKAITVHKAGDSASTYINMH